MAAPGFDTTVYPSKRLAWMGAVVVVCGLSGCQSEETSHALAEETSHLKPLSVMYGMMGQPRDEAQFKAFVNSRAKTMFRALDFESPEELFVSERDGQPYVIFYGKRPAGVNPEVIGYEQEGVGGKRMVGFRIGEVREVDEEEFRTLVPQ